MIEVYADPLNGVYQLIRQVWQGETITPRLLPSIVLKAEDLLG